LLLNSFWNFILHC